MYVRSYYQKIDLAKDILNVNYFFLNLVLDV